MGIIENIKRYIPRFVDKPTKSAAPSQERFAKPQTYQSSYGRSYTANLTPEKVAAAIRKANMGEPQSLMHMFSEIVAKDARLTANFQTRKEAAVSREWSVTPASEETHDIEIADFVKANLENLVDFREDMLDILDSIGKGFSVLEIMWEVLDGSVQIADLIFCDQANFKFSSDLETLLYVAAGDSDGIELEPNKFVVHFNRSRSGQRVAAGLLRPLIWLYLFKNYSLKDWATFAEVYGFPLRIGKYPIGFDKKDELLEMLASIGRDAFGIIPDNVALEFVETGKTGSAQPHPGLIDYCNKEMSICILGHTGSSESTPGKLGSEQASENVRGDLIKSDARSLANTIRWQLIKPLVDYNFGEQDVYPRFEFNLAPPIDLKAESEKDLAILKETGIEYSETWLRSKYNIPAPDAVEDTLQVEQGGGNPLGFRDIIQALKLKDDLGQAEAERIQNAIDKFSDGKKKRPAWYTGKSEDR